MTSNPSLSIVAPCFNEEDSLHVLCERIDKALTFSKIDFELVLVNDGSRDSTLETIKLLAGTKEWIKVVNHHENLGIAAAWASGVNNASGDYICLIDADLQNLPEDIPRLFQHLIASKSDFVQAYRSEIDRKDKTRFLISKIFNFLLNTIFGDHARDNKSGFLIGPKFALEEILTLNVGKRYFHFQSLIRPAARSRGYSFTEIETLFAERHAGESFLKGIKTYRTIIESFLDLIVGAIKIGRGKGDSTDGSLLPNTRKMPKIPHPYRGLRRVIFELYFFTMPLHKWIITRNARRLYLQLKAVEYFSTKQISEYQLDKLNRLLHHSVNRVPYYRKIHKTQKTPVNLQDLLDLKDWPFLDKENVRENLYFDLFSENHNKKEMHKVSTSGSTGQPFTTYADKFQLEVRFATTLRALEWTGWRFGDRQARLWHQTIGMTRGQVLREKVDSMFMRRIFIPAFEINPKNIEKFIGRIRKHRPVLVDGYAESLNFLASYVTAGGAPGFKPLAMMSSAQTMPDNVKERIEIGFNTKVFDKYGSREFSGIAYQCEASNDHHVMSESYILELLTEGRPSLPGEVGEIVITDLNNYSVPLIRYRIGDLAEAVDNSIPCGCGRNQPRIGRIQGRSQAIVKCGNGTWMPGTFFAHFFKDFEQEIKFFQIHQRIESEMELKIVKGQGWTESKFLEVIDSLKRHIGQESKVKIVFVDDIPLLRTGKRSPVVSELKLDFQSIPQELMGKQ